MALFDALINDIAGRFGLGATATGLVREVLSMVVNSPGGIGGFLDRLKSAGLSSAVTSWLGNANAAALTTQQLDSAVSSSVLSQVAGRLGIAAPLASTAVGYVLPKVIGLLTPGGKIPTLPSRRASWGHGGSKLPNQSLHPTAAVLRFIRVQRLTSGRRG